MSEKSSDKPSNDKLPEHVNIHVNGDLVDHTPLQSDKGIMNLTPFAEGKKTFTEEDVQQISVSPQAAETPQPPKSKYRTLLPLVIKNPK